MRYSRFNAALDKETGKKIVRPPLLAIHFPRLIYSNTRTTGLFYHPLAALSSLPLSGARRCSGNCRMSTKRSHPNYSAQLIERLRTEIQIVWQTANSVWLLGRWQV